MFICIHTCDRQLSRYKLCIDEQLCVCVCACVRACVRARACVCVCVRRVCRRRKVAGLTSRQLLSGSLYTIQVRIVFVRPAAPLRAVSFPQSVARTVYGHANRLVGSVCFM